MKKPTGRRSALAALAAMAALVLTVTPASAVPSTVWTVTPSPALVTGTNSANATVNVNGDVLNCAKSGFTAALHSATGNPAQVGTFGSFTFGTASTPCTGVLGPVSVTATTPWTFTAQDHTAATGVTKGYVDAMDLTVSGGSLSIRARGKAPASYTNATGRLVIDGTAGQLLITQTSDGTVFPIGTSVIVKAAYQLKLVGGGGIATIVGTAP
ncbi:hypothetical protein [Streptomyces sp. NPDC093111]|uniref:hypothetical protein n=1 Tax=Streptomyces sp. NPDC093111 TaxID=3154978 RepID=UPI00342AC3BA